MITENIDDMFGHWIFAITAYIQIIIKIYSIHDDSTNFVIFSNVELKIKFPKSV